MLLTTPTECVKNHGTCLAMPVICLEYKLFHYHAWSYYQFFCPHYNLWQNYSILASFCISSTSYAFTLHSLVIASHTLHFLNNNHI